MKRVPIKKMSGDDIDRQYGLEPVFEPGARDADLDDFIELACPYCAEWLTLPLDLAAGDQSYVEDCHVCCQPMAVSVTVDDAGRLRAVTARRGDD